MADTADNGNDGNNDPGVVRFELRITATGRVDPAPDIEESK